MPAAHSEAAEEREILVIYRMRLVIFRIISHSSLDPSLLLITEGQPTPN